jgi:hypothetical protein
MMKKDKIQIDDDVDIEMRHDMNVMQTCLISRLVHYDAMFYDYF